MARGTLDSTLPKPPDVGFFGRDETLLALDRAFDRQNIVLLSAYAGSGKTSTAVEFARWYALTGGVEGPVLFTSFAQYRPLPQVLDEIGRVFETLLEQAGVHWLALDKDRRRHVALQVLAQVSVLWVWDNVEPVAGFPEGAASVWSMEEQQELVDFLRDARGTKAKFLLTSRHAERAWLGDLPARIRLPRMPMQERMQLARALAEKHGRRLTEIADWRPLLRFTDGNPLTITVLVSQALRDGLRTPEEIEAFVNQLRGGEGVFEDEESEARSKSLGASLRYGFEHAFSEAERRQLALLHLFQGFVAIDALCSMGIPDADWCLSTVRGLTRQQGIALLDRAAEVGLLTAVKVTPQSFGCYSIHPALPWFFRSLFEVAYPAASGEDQRARKAFVGAMASMSYILCRAYSVGSRGLLAALAVEEDNLLAAWRLARANGWWSNANTVFEGLHLLYEETGRRTALRRLVEAVVPDFVDPTTDGPLPGREEEWGSVTQRRIKLAKAERHWAVAERLAQMYIDWARQRAASALGKDPKDWTEENRHRIRSLASSLFTLAEIQRERGEAACVPTYQNALDLAQRIGDHTLEANAAFDLGSAYLLLPALRNLDEAERYYQRSLDLREQSDGIGRGGSLRNLGMIAHARFKEALAAQRPSAELLSHLQEALDYLQRGLKEIPGSAIHERAVAHNGLGVVYMDAGDFDRALTHYSQAIKFSEDAGRTYEAGIIRHNVAVSLARAGRFGDALAYAEAALKDFQSFGSGTADIIQQNEALIADLKRTMPQSGR
jgi:tetratricopeptide (TPR) repeat protein